MKVLSILMLATSFLITEASNKLSVSDEVWGAIVGLGFITLLLFLYFIPTVIAYKRNRNNKVVILIINLFFGLTALGWLVALAFALNGAEK